MWEEAYLKHESAVRVFSLDDALDSDNDADDAMSLDEQDGLPAVPLCGDTEAMAAVREETFRTAWKACHDDITSVLRGLYDETVTQIHKFVHDAPVKPVLGQRALTTGAILGANQTLSTAVATALRQPLPEIQVGQAGPSSLPDGSSNVLVARISSRESVNKRTALRSLVQAVIAAGSELDAREEATLKRPPGKKLSMAASDDIEVLISWYQARYGKRTHPPRVVIYFEDFESFDSAVLTDLLYILSQRCHQLPLVLLFAISTSIDVIHNLLPRATSALLRIATFTVEPSIETFHSLMLETFIKRKQVLTPSSRLFAFLRDSFLDLHQSIDGVIAKLHYMYLAHFYGNPLSVLCERMNEDLEPEDQLELLAGILPSLISLTSFQKSIQENIDRIPLAKDKKRACSAASYAIEDDGKLLRSVNVSRVQRDAYAARLPEAWALFEVLQSSWTEGRSSTETLLTEYFAGSLTRRAETACRNLRNARDDTCLSFLNAAVKHFTDHEASCPCSLSERVFELETIIETGARQSGLTRLVNGNIQGSTARSEGDKRYTAFVSDLADTLETYFETSLSPYTQLTCHEIWYPDTHRIMRSAFHPHVLDQLEATLKTPSSRLPLHLLDDPEDVPRREDLDVCLAHKLLAEAGKLVNLADWHGAFEVALEDENKEDPARRRRREPSPKRRRKDKGADASSGSTTLAGAEDSDDDEESARIRSREARFLLSAADLAYLGFVQPTKRKAEHAARIIF